MTHISIGPLVRATSANSVTIWVECTQPCTVTLKVLPIESGDAPLPTGSSHTVIVGGHHYALVYLDGLQPATWYTYHLDIDGQEDIESVETTSEQHFKHQDTAPQLYCFRTMNVHEAGQAASQQTRYNYASPMALVAQAKIKRMMPSQPLAPGSSATMNSGRNNGLTSSYSSAIRFTPINHPQPS